MRTWVQLTILLCHTEKEAHSSMPEEGINAINNLNEFITEANQQMAEVTANYEKS